MIVSRSNFMRTTLVALEIVIFFGSFHVRANYTIESLLESSESEVDGESQNTYFRPEYVNREERWYNGEVRYHLDASFIRTRRNIQQLSQSILEFEKKTCIRFTEETSNEGHFVRIQRWMNYKETDCGKASVCMRNNQEQYAQFTPNCMKKAVFVHELAHGLCLSHEFLRRDRDEFVSFDGCTKVPNITDDSTTYHGIYDYASQTHYPCSCKGGGGRPLIPDWPSTCGGDIPGNDGLSVLDADAINKLYGCQGCHRHRWIPIDNISETDKENMYSFGHVDYKGRSIFPCRALVRGEVAVGEYAFEDRACSVPSRFKNAVETVTEEKGSRYAEVLTIPGGLSAQSKDGSEGPLFQYELVNVNTEPRARLLETAIPAGNGWRMVHGGGFANSFIAFGSLTLDQYKIPYNLSVAEEYLPAIENIGNLLVWNDDRGVWLDAFFTTSEGSLVNAKDYKVLVCK